ncbi:pseudouridine synthase [Humidisolicoccus flavus]|uniref:pseudouridine synthase n=1 Tax=Humidisolicoccus flavus TaxID=3111414 RepID=UPI00324CE06F
MTEQGERVQKVLAAAGVASRRVVEDMIVEGRIVVNGEIMTELGRRITLEDRVEVDGYAVQLDVSKRYILLNKPVGVVSSLRDEQGRPDLREFTEQYEERLYNVGRLDIETSGLLVLTNDGDLAHTLAHPSFGVEKTYIARVRGSVGKTALRELRKGFELEDGFIKADKVRTLDNPSQGFQMVEITLHSGRNRIVRRMFDHIDNPVVELVRRQFGPLHLGTLRQGHMREVNRREMGELLTLSRGASGKERPLP